MDYDNKLVNMDGVEMKLPEENFLSTEPTTKKVSGKPILLVGIILILIGILGGLLWWGSEFIELPESFTPVSVSIRPTAEENDEPESNNAEADVQIIRTVSPSSDPAAIEADLVGSNIEALDSDLQTIDSILGL